MVGATVLAMTAGSEVDLLAIALPRAEAAAAVRRAWDDRRPVAVLDPDLPRGLFAQRLAHLRPGRLLDGSGEHPIDRAVPVAAGIAAVVTTSGTTAEPKLVELTWDGLAASARGVSTALAVEPDRDRWLLCVPLTAVAGLAIVARGWLTGTPVVVHDRFDAAAVVGAPARDGATLVSLVATQLARVVALGADLGEWRAVLLGGGPIPTLLRDRVATETHATYGMTETWGGCVHDGHALPGIELRLAAADHEIEIRGACVMADYRGDAPATAAAFAADGWYRTGDVGAIDAAGTLSVTDRKRDLIITGGVNVSPSAIEAVLGDHPAVLDVAVVGQPDAEWGERVTAYVVPCDPARAPSVADLRAFARDRLSGPELPRALVVVDALPRTDGGKLRRTELRAPRPTDRSANPPA
jgi:O-succinylbenzoic acid--CoA ligase